VLTRQGLPTVRLKHSDDNLCAKGAYVLADAEGGARQATILATGSEVSIALEARKRLAADSIRSAVVSMPCWDLFEAQADAYKAKVLGAGGARVADEAAVRLGWDKYVGASGGFVGMTGFGASAPGDALFPHIGITAEAVVAEVKKRLS
jgi:transketolase